MAEAYSPIAHGEILKNDQITKISEKQICLRYCLQLGMIILPKTTHTDPDFAIADDDMNF